MKTSLYLFAAVVLFAGQVLPAAADQAAAARYYEDAEIQFENKAYPAAVIQLKNALREYPEHRPSHILMGRAYLGMGEAAAAEGHLLNARELGADEALIVLPLAESFLQQRKFKEVILSLRYSGYAPDVEYRLRTLQGRAHTELGELDKAAKAYRDAQRIDPMAPEPLAGEALVLLLQGSVELARTKARVATERAPQSVAAWQAVAAVSHASGNVEQALDAYGRIIAIEPNHREARVARASLLLELDRDAEAEADIDNVRSNAPFEVRATYLKSVLLKKRGEDKQSQALLSETAQLLNAVSDDVLAAAPRLQLLAGLTNFSLKAYEQAEDYLNRFLSNRPQDLGARRMLGSIYLSRKDYARAVDILEPVLERTPNDPRVLHMTARALTQLKRYDAALPMLELAVTMSRGSISIRTDLAFARLAVSDTPRALEDFRAIMRDDPSQMRAGMTLSAMLMRRGEFEEVIKLAQGLLEHYPKSKVARNLLATGQFRSGKHAEARVLLEGLAAEDPTFLPARVNLAKIDLMEGRRAEARERFLTILQEQPEHVGTMLEVARLAEQDGDLQGAAEWAEKALSVRSKWMPAIEYLIDLRLRLGQVGQALRIANNAESWAKDDDRFMLSLARVHLADKKPAVARAILQRMATSAGYDTQRLMLIADMQNQAGAPDDAAWSLQKAVSSDPAFVPARVELVAVLLRLGRMDAAMDAAEALRKAAPGTPTAFGTMGEVLAAAGRNDEALEQFRLALAAEASELAATRYARTLARIDQRRADQWLAQWVVDHPAHRLARLMLAERNLQRGDFQRARSDYEQLIKWRPDDAGLLNNYAHILRRLGDPRSLEVAERAQQLAPNDPNINDTLGWMLVEAGESQRGLSFLRNAHSRSGLDPEIRYHIAVALHNLDRRDEARRELEAALASQRSFREREEAKQLLEQLAK